MSVTLKNWQNVCATELFIINKYGVQADIEMCHATTKMQTDSLGWTPLESRYELNEHLADLFEQAMQTLDKKLTYARYQAIAYLKPEAANGLYDNAELISHSLAGIRKNGLVKRLESSFYAFQVSLDNFRQNQPEHDRHVQ